MSAQVTSEQLNQLLSFGSLAAVIAGVPPEVALGALAGAVIFVIWLYHRSDNPRELIPGRKDDGNA